MSRFFHNSDEQRGFDNQQSHSVQYSRHGGGYEYEQGWNEGERQDRREREEREDRRREEEAEERADERRRHEAYMRLQEEDQTDNLNEQ